jgi:glycosyltransferase involved in cell wall biosynthesis
LSTKRLLGCGEKEGRNNLNDRPMKAVQKKIVVEFRGTLRPLYRELLENPPSGIKYRIYDPSYSMLARKFWNKTWVPGKVARHIYWRLRYNRLFNGTLLHLSNYWDYSPIRMRRNFVADTENVGTFVSNWKFEDLQSPLVRRTIEDSIRSKYCRKIMPLTYAAKRTMEAIFAMEGLNEKVEVVYPAIRPLQVTRTRRNIIRILFVGSNFLIKGGRELIEAFRMLRKRFDAELVIVSQDAYDTMQPEDNVTIHASTPRQQLLSKFFPAADIFCLPTYADSFGFVFLEAKAAALPIVSTTHFHVPEIVDDGKTGLLVKAPISCWKTDFTYNYDWFDSLKNMRFPKTVSELADKLSILIEDNSLRLSMGEAAKREVTEGKFSIDARNRKLEEIYEKAQPTSLTHVDYNCTL